MLSFPPPFFRLCFCPPFVSLELHPGSAGYVCAHALPLVIAFRRVYGGWCRLFFEFAPSWTVSTLFLAVCPWQSPGHLMRALATAALHVSC